MFAHGILAFLASSFALSSMCCPFLLLSGPCEPHSFSSAGSKSDWDGSFWEPIAPPGYTALGHVARRSHTDVPSLDYVRCVKSSLLEQIDYEWQWNDLESGSHNDVTVWRAKAVGSTVYTMGTMIAVPGRALNGRRAFYGIKSAECELPVLIK